VNALEEDVPATDQPRCVDCGAHAPQADTSFALIRTAGWRLTRPMGADGRLNAHWRCARCWSAFKDAATEARPGANHRA
jgi:hypothetical protein